MHSGCACVSKPIYGFDTSARSSSTAAVDYNHHNSRGSSRSGTLTHLKSSLSRICGLFRPHTRYNQPPLQEASCSWRLFCFSGSTGAAIFKYHVVPRTRRPYHHAPQRVLYSRDANVASSCRPGQCAMFPLLLRLRAPPALGICQFLSWGHP